MAPSERLAVLAALAFCHYHDFSGFSALVGRKVTMNNLAFGPDLGRRGAAMATSLRFASVSRFLLIVVGAAFVLALNTQGGTAAQMSAELRQLVEQEATKIAPNYCTAWLKGYDCSCFAQKVHDYRLKEFVRDGENMMTFAHSATIHAKILAQPLNNIMSSKWVDYGQCALQ